MSKPNGFGTRLGSIVHALSYCSDEAYECQQVLLKHQKGKRKGQVFRSPSKRQRSQCPVF